MRLAINQDDYGYQFSLVRVNEFVGTDFNNGERTFVSSEGVVLHSTNNRLAVHPRTGQLVFPETPDAECFMRKNVIPQCGHSKMYLKGIAVAIKEYNKKFDTKEQRISLILGASMVGSDILRLFEVL